MTDETSNLVLELLRVMREEFSKLSAKVDNLAAEVRISNQHVAALMQNDTHQSGLIAELQVRVERIEKRLELVS